MSKVRLTGSTSGYTEIQASAVAGDNTLSLPTTTDGTLLAADSSGNVNLDSGTLYVDAANNRVGIGVTGPQYPLHTETTGTGTAAGDNTAILVQSQGDGRDCNIRFGDNVNASARIGYLSNNLYFYVNGSERARIDSSGRVGIGTTSPATRLDLFGTDCKLRIRDSAQANGLEIYQINADGGSAIYAANNNYLKFGTNNTERARITSSGAFLFATSDQAGIDAGTVDGKYIAGSGAGGQMFSSRSATATRNHIVFTNPNGVVGTISTTSSATAYNTSSDYRLKENVVPLTGASDRVNQLQVHRFNFIADPTTTVDGFIAHEAQAVVPECVTGTKDEVDENGNPVYQGIDQSKLVPLLTAALQEALSEIADLKTRITALEAN